MNDPIIATALSLVAILTLPLGCASVDDGPSGGAGQTSDDGNGEDSRREDGEDDRSPLEDEENQIVLHSVEFDFQHPPIPISAWMRFVVYEQDPSYLIGEFEMSACDLGNDLVGGIVSGSSCGGNIDDSSYACLDFFQTMDVFDGLSTDSDNCLSPLVLSLSSEPTLREDLDGFSYLYGFSMTDEAGFQSRFVDCLAEVDWDGNPIPSDESCQIL